jgi:glucans biosynthesis protein C
MGIKGNTMKAFSERRYDLDWLRVLGVLLLVPFHVALIFVLDPNSIMYVKDVVNSPVLDEAAGFVHLLHMPLLFAISGASTYYALGFRSAGAYTRERFLRLLIPFLFGVVTYIPLTTFIHRAGSLSFPEHYLGFFTFDLEHLDGFNGTFTPAHLWFILFLFVFSLAALPLFLGLRTGKGRGLVNALATVAQAPGSLFLWVIPLALVASLDLLGDKNPLYYFLVFCSGYLLASDARFQTAIDKLTWFALAYGIFEAVFLRLIPQWHYAEWSWPWATLGLMYELGRWALTLAALGLGHRFLNRTNRLLRYLSEAAMPFYLLHMTFSVLAGAFVIRFELPVAVKYPLIVFLATTLTLAAYELVRRWDPTRWLFGMKKLG